MRTYCTLSDRRYLPKLIAMHQSLLANSWEPFRLHVLTMNSEAHWLLYDLNLENVELFPLSALEVALNLQDIRKSRTWQEYCWTCASNLMEFLMPWVGEVTYLDADLFFFGDTRLIFEEIGSKSIGITPHRFPQRLKHLECNGRFNVGWVTAKSTRAGLECISKWAADCRKWCFNRIEGKNACGDQKYLDAFEAHFPGEVHAIANPGVNLAPWNIEQYRIEPGPTVDGNPVIFYHLHEFVNPGQLTNYPLRHEDRQHIYNPYISAWQLAQERIREAEERAAVQRDELEAAAHRA